MISPPKIECRTTAEILAETAARLEARWPGLSKDPFASALAQIFGRYCEIVIERLNRVPEKNRVAFLDLLGLSPVPPVSARVALSFEPVRQMPGGRGTVPRYTKVAAAGPSGPVVFETQGSLELTAAKLDQAISYDPLRDGWCDHSALLSVEGSFGEQIFTGQVAAIHEFFIGQREVFGMSGTADLRLEIALETELDPPLHQRIQWFIPTPGGEMALIPAVDETAELSRSGFVVFRNLPPWPTHSLGGCETAWLGCRWLAALPAVGDNSARLPKIRSICIAASRRVENLPIARACCNGQILDISKDFFPLGEMPRFGDVCYLSSPEFAYAGAELCLAIALTNPASAGGKSPIPPTTRQGNPVIQWEAWSGERWVRLTCRDDSQGLTEDGVVSFRLPETMAETVVAGLAGYWLRACLVGGSYPIDPADRGSAWPAAAAAPCIRRIVIASCLELGPRPADAVFRRDSVRAETAEIIAGRAFEPFCGAAEPTPSLYLGLRADAPIAGPRLDLYFQAAEPEISTVHSRQSRQSSLIWQGWNGGEWMELSVNDETRSLARSGMVRLTLPEPLLPWRASYRGSELCWLRVRRGDGEPSQPPRLRRILLNTAPAEHVLTLENEELGSSSGLAFQMFRTARNPIVGELNLEVRERGRPGAAPDAGGAGGRTEYWVPWQEVSDFLASGPTDRHFTVDRITGEIRFGDGRRGCVPPPGGNNIRLARYQSGGGVVGNLPSQCLTQLRSGMPFVKAVTNLDPARGGLDRETMQALLERGSRQLRHRRRAVTTEDYEDLALEASPAVVKAKCYPLRNLADGTARLDRGVISLVVVARDGDTCPKAELLGRVRAYLERYRAPFAELIVVSPAYVAVSVRAAVAAEPDTGAAALLAICEQRLSRFLDPLDGGDDGRGWPFGSLPKPSDFYAVLEAIPGLAYVHSLALQTGEERSGLLRDGTYLVRSGTHRIDLVT